jgi:hypothetical protein
MELRQELNNQRPRTAGIEGQEWEDEKIGLELQIEQLKARCHAMEDE